MVRFFVIALLMVVFSEAASYKIVISSDKEIDKASVVLNDMEQFFQENSNAKVLKEEHAFQLKMELLGDYVLTVIKPINTKALKNELNILLSSRYPGMFTIKETESPMKNNGVALKSHVENNSEKVLDKSNSLVDGITNQWLLFLMLSLLGILLMYMLGKQISKIKKLQKKLEKEQMDLDTQIGNIEGAVS